MSVMPPPPTGKPAAVWDTEVYPNYFLLKFRTAGHKQSHAWRLRVGQRLTTQQCDEINALFARHVSYSFNGIGFDQWIMSAALAGGDVAMLCWVRDQIIVNDVRGWDLNLPRWEPADHVDLMEVAPGMGSLKLYAARIHSHSIRDLPYDPDAELTEEQIANLDAYCENDLDDLEDLYHELAPQREQRDALTKRYGIDLRSKSDAQLAEAVLKLRCEQSLGRKIYKAPIDYGLRFKFDMPPFINYNMPQLQRVKQLVEQATFGISSKPSKKNPGEMSHSVDVPPELEGLVVGVGSGVYKIGIGGLHSQEKRSVHKAEDGYVLRDRDVASYYPSLILNSGRWPAALGPAFLSEYAAIKDERLHAKHEQGRLKKLGDTSSHAYVEAKVGNEGGKIMINGSFGKTGSIYSILFAPEMMIQTTLSGQLALLMLIEWHESLGIQIVSANTDGIVVKCHESMLPISEELCREWERVTGLELEATEYAAVYSRDVNNYFAVKTNGEVKRKGEYSKAGLVEKKNPDVEICADAAAEWLASGTPIADTIRACRDIRKFVTVIRVNGGGVKMWGEGVRKGTKVADMIPVIEQHGWTKQGRKWTRGGCEPISAAEAYALCFQPQRPEYLGKVVRWYYSTQAPGPIVYATNGNNVSLSYGAKPCMVLPAELPDDIDYDWYINKAHDMLRDVGAL